MTIGLVRIAIYLIAFIVMRHYDMPWYASASTTLLIAVGTVIGAQPEEAQS